MGKRLLVVDSDRRFIQDHKSPLESAFEVDFLYATDGALTMLESGQYGAVLLCAETSEGKGYGLCSAIRRTSSMTGMKVALISAKATEEEYARHRATKGRADLYLHKPIVSSALIPALAGLVPMREDDPDNPLGDLAGADLGEEWLESLKTELDAEPARPASAPRTIAPVPGWLEPALDKPASRNQGEVELLEWRVKDLELKLAARYEDLEKKNHELESLRQENASVTRNLDEAHQTQGDVELLRQRILDREAAFTRLQDELQEALDEQKRLIDEAEETGTLLAEKTQKNTELLESHQLLQAQLEEAWEAGDQAKRLAGDLAQLEARAGAAERGQAALQTELDAARAELADRDAKLQDREHEKIALLQERDADRARLQALEAELAAAHEQIAFQELSVGNLAAERAGLQADRDRQEAALAEQAGELIVLQEKVAQLEHAARDLTEEKDKLDAFVGRLEKQLETLEAAHEAQRRELVAGIGEREGQLARLNAALDGHKEKIDQLGRERQTLVDQLQGREDRLTTLAGVLVDLEARTRQALDLAKAPGN